jgi:hypothetical protein
MHAAPNRRSTKRARAVLAGALLGLSPWICRPLRANDVACDARIHLVAKAPTYWEPALRQLCDELANLQDVDPTARLELTPTDDEVRVEVTLSDGRRAVRHVRRPETLFSTVEALMVTVPRDAEPPPQAVAAPPSASTLSDSTTRLPGPQPLAASIPPPPMAATPRVREPATAAVSTFELGALLTGRISGAPTYLGTGFAIHASVLVPAWLLGVVLRWDLLETLANGAPPGFEMETVGAGFLLAHGVFEERDLTLRIGGSAQLLATTQSMENGNNETNISGIDLRLGILTQWLIGTAPLRWTVTLDSELSPGRIRRTMKLYEPLPVWSLGLGVGATWELR